MSAFKRFAHVSLLLPLLLLVSPDTGLGQCTPPTRNFLLIATDAGARRDTIFFGHGPTATTGTDTGLCERELPPLPPSGVYDLRFANPPGHEGVQPPAGLGQGSVRDYRTQLGPAQSDTFRVRFQPGLGGFPVTFSWSPASMAAAYDSARLVDEVGGVLYSVSMLGVPSLTVTNPAVTSLLLITHGMLQIPAAPALLSPVNGAADQSVAPLLSWAATAGAARYAVQIGTDSLFAAPVFSDTAVLVPSRTVSGLPVGTTCYWRVRASNGAGTGPWSPVWHFGTIALPGVPQPVAPAQGASGVSVGTKLIWNGALRASSYHVQMATDSLFTSPVLDDEAVTDTARTLSSLAASTRYFWRVAGRNGGGQGSWSIVRNFTSAGPVSNPYAVNAGWNLISLPLAVANGRRTVVYPTAISSAFAFGSNGYVPEDSLHSGTGYWLKFPSVQNVSVTGLTVLRDTIPVQAGWNLVGTVSAAVDTGSVQQIPPGLLLTSFFGFSGSYLPVSVLQPGSSYWVKAGSAGSIVVSAPATVPARPASRGPVSPLK